MSSNFTSHFRPDIDAMDGYVPGEQPKDPSIVKLNTNESPYPPSPALARALADFDLARLRLYPDPVGSFLRQAIASYHGLSEENVILGNGSDDILTMATRSLSDSSMPLACLEPTYSLYPTLARLQGSQCLKVPLSDAFELPEDILTKAEGANFFMLARPNAPTGNSFPLEQVERFCSGFKGVVLIDEAYSDFADDNCAGLVPKLPNVIVSRTFSKSRSLAGLRFGYALAHPKTIEGLMKMKDSYNVSMLTQMLALASLKDNEHFSSCVAMIKESREWLKAQLESLGFKVVPSQANFLFASPPDGDGRAFFAALRKRRILVRYFPGERTSSYVRITIGTSSQMEALVSAAKSILIHGDGADR